MTKTVNPITGVTAPYRPDSRGTPNTLVPRPVIAHQVGGHLALDFCNTVGEHLAGQPQELLQDWESFLRWATQSGLLGPDSYCELLKFPKALGPVIQLREAVYRVGLSITGARRLSKRDTDVIRHRANASRPEVVFLTNGAQWRPAPSHAIEQLCSVLGAEALSLFCSPSAARIRVCEGGDCGWLFLDQSRGKRRRWCDMNDCGSRAKARRYYENHRRT